MGYIYDRFYKRSTGYYAAQIEKQRAKLREYNAQHRDTMDAINSSLLSKLGQANVDSITLELKKKQSLALFRKKLANDAEDVQKRMVDLRL